jgi:hypothetical protein
LQPPKVVLEDGKGCKPRKLSQSLWVKRISKYFKSNNKKRSFDEVSVKGFLVYQKSYKKI